MRGDDKWKGKLVFDTLMDIINRDIKGEKNAHVV